VLRVEERRMEEEEGERQEKAEQGEIGGFLKSRGNWKRKGHHDRSSPSVSLRAFDSVWSR